MSAPRVTALVVTYNSRSTVGAALASLRPAFDAGLLVCTVVDNASADGTLEHVREEYPWVRALESGGNLGFGRGNNAGLKTVESEFTLLLNPDAALAHEDLGALIAFLDQNSNVGIVGPALDNGDGAAQELHPFPTPGLILREALGRPSNADRPRSLPSSGDPFPADWLCGAALLIRTSVLDALDGFDPRFFLYFEETDLCYRCRALGREVWVVPAATAHHLTHASARGTNKTLYHGCIAEHYFKSRYYYMRKHFGWLRASSAELADLVMTAARSVLRRMRGRHLGELGVRLRAPRFRSPDPV